MSRRVRPLALGVIVVLLAASSSAGCGDGGEESTPATPGPGTAAPGTAGSGPDGAREAPSLRGDGLGVVDFGASADDAVAAMAAALGQPDDDTGWQPSFSVYGTCPGEEVRAVSWGALLLLFTDGTTGWGSGEHLFSWRLAGAPPAIATAAGLGIGATPADAVELHGDAVTPVPAEPPFPPLLAIDLDGGTITAFLDDAGEVVTNLEGGAPCGE